MEPRNISDVEGKTEIVRINHTTIEVHLTAINNDIVPHSMRWAILGHIILLGPLTTYFVESGKIAFFLSPSTASKATPEFLGQPWQQSVSKGGNVTKGGNAPSNDPTVLFSFFQGHPSRNVTSPSSNESALCS
jgi:hypothetical protein